MQLVLWRPPEDALARRLKDSLQRQRKQQQQFVNRQSTSAAASATATGVNVGAPATPPPQMHLKDFGEGALSPDYGSPVVQESGEEDMEL